MDTSGIFLSGTVKTKLLATKSSSYNRVRLQTGSSSLDSVRKNTEHLQDLFNVMQRPWKTSASKVLKTQGTWHEVRYKHCVAPPFCQRGCLYICCSFHAASAIYLRVISRCNLQSRHVRFRSDFLKTFQPMKNCVVFTDTDGSKR